MMKKKPIAYEIQTTNRCNARCVICPHRDIHQSYETMDMQIFRKIIDEISLSGEAVRIVLYLNGEPLLDEFFVERLQYTREKCRDAIIEVSTNLSVLRPEILEAIKKYDIDDFRISCFGFCRETYESIMPGLKYEVFLKHLNELDMFRKKYDKLKNISITMIDVQELQDKDLIMAKQFCNQHDIKLNFWGFLDRAGNVKGRSNFITITPEDEKEKRYTCAQNRHVERMHILVDGTVVLCCQDWRKEYVLGSVKTDDLHTIWESEPYEKLRRQIDQIGESYPEICKKCKILLEGKKE